MIPRRAGRAAARCRPRAPLRRACAGSTATRRYAAHPRGARGRGRHRRRRLVGGRSAGPQRRRRADADRPRPGRRVQHQPPGPGARQHARAGQGRRRCASASPQIHPGCVVHGDRGVRGAATTGRHCCRAGVDAVDRRLRPGAAPRWRWRPGRCDAARRSSRRRGRRQAAGAARWTWTTSAQVTHDPLLAQLRQRLRKLHGAPREGAIGVRLRASAASRWRRPMRRARSKATAASTATATARASA